MTSHFAYALAALLAVGGAPNIAGASTEAQSPELRTDEKASGVFLPKERRAPVVYESPTGGILFKATVAGHDVWAMLDTGAARSFMDIDLAVGAGLAVSGPEEGVSSPKGGIPMRRVADVAVEVPGQISLRFPKLAAIDLSAAGAAVGRKVQFILGADLLQSLVLIIDPSKHTFQLGPSGIFTAPMQSVEVSLRGGRPPQIEVTIGNQKALVTVSTAFRGQIALTTAAWDKFVPGTTSAAGKVSTLGEIEIGTLRLNDVEIRETTSAEEGDGVLGAAILGRFRLAMDIKKGKMWLLPSPPATASK